MTANDGVRRRVVCHWRSGHSTVTEWMDAGDPRIRGLLAQVDDMHWARVEREDDPNMREGQ